MPVYIAAACSHPTNPLYVSKTKMTSPPADWMLPPAIATDDSLQVQDQPIFPPGQEYRGWPGQQTAGDKSYATLETALQNRGSGCRVVKYKLKLNRWTHDNHVTQVEHLIALLEKTVEFDALMSNF